MLNWDQGLVLNVSVLDRTHSKREDKRGDWMKQWLMIQNFTAPNTTYRKKTHEKQASSTTPKGTEKQLDYILVDRKHVYCSRDAVANDLIHIGKRPQKCYGTHRDYSTKKEVSQKTHKQPRRKSKQQRAQRAKMMKKKRSDEANKFEERYAELERRIKHEAEIAATTQKPTMTESKQAEGVIDAEVAASLHWNEDGKRRSEDAIWKTCCGSQTHC